MFCDRLSSQLASQEEKKQGKKQEQLVGDRLPRLLAGDVFYTSVVEHQKAAEEEAVALETHRQERDERANLMKVWKEDNAKWLERNEAHRQVYKEELTQWEAEQTKAKMEKWCPMWVKPKLGKLKTPLPKPMIIHVDEEAEETKSEDSEDT
ncbi:hypothetical protein BDR06DRAFT_872059 [Suillus hirtellus]|nr:hypothetical protein BDR06DRAFT_872059 [Suillus hirtellus]